MIRFVKGDLLEAPEEAVVNAVNTAGVMGKGLALLFKKRFPENFHAYESACRAGTVKVGSMFVTTNPELTGPRWIINFPTKQHWRQPSDIEWINSGLVDLKAVILKEKIRSIAIPRLGCGLGGLEWGVVRPKIVAMLDGLPDVEGVIYESP